MMQQSTKTTAKRLPVVTAFAAVLMVSTTMMTGVFAIPPTEITRDGGLHFVGDPDLILNKEVNEFGRITSTSLTAEGNQQESSGVGRID